jgi:hypothetical protein
VIGLEATQHREEVRLVVAVTAVACDHQRPAQGGQRADRIGFAVGEPIRVECE